jgi:RHS repeat-associated protein
MAKTYLFWDPLEDNVVRETDEAGVVTAEYTTEPEQYGNVISQRRAGQYRQFHYDGQGSTLAATDENQAVTDTFAYSAFGEVTERTGTSTIPFQYIGQKGYYRDSLTGQYLVRMRPYEPSRARWQARDQLGIRPRDMNVYSYVRNRAAMTIDPSGLFCFCECICRTLQVKELGWKIFYFPGYLTRSPGRLLSYVFLFEATSTGDRACRLNISLERGKRTEIRDGVESVSSGGILQWFSDSYCALPSWPFSGGFDNLKCLARYDDDACTGNICVVDAPGAFIDGYGFFDIGGYTKPKSKLCVKLDLEFKVNCWGNLIMTTIEDTLRIQREACVTIKNGRLDTVEHDGRSESPVALEVSPRDMIDQCTASEGGLSD